MDDSEEMDRGDSLQDMLSHRMDMPRHDFSGIQRKDGVSEMVSHNTVVILLYRSDARNHRCKRRFQNVAVPSTFRRLSRNVPVQ